MTWEEAVEHPSLQDLPFKIELNGDGNIVMSPTFNPHGSRQFRIGMAIAKSLPDGEVATEIGVRTSDNVKVADVAWFTAAHWATAKEESACTVAPEICVEVASQSNSRSELNQKKALYFEAGAKEVWFCDRKGKMSFFTPEGPVANSRLCPEVAATF